MDPHAQGGGEAGEDGSFSVSPPPASSPAVQEEDSRLRAVCSAFGLQILFAVNIAVTKRYR